VSADRKGTPEVHGKMDLSKHMLFQSVRLVGAVGIELKATLKARKLLIPVNEKNAKNIGFAQVRYTAGTRRLNQIV